MEVAGSYFFWCQLRPIILPKVFPRLALFFLELFFLFCLEEGKEGKIKIISFTPFSLMASIIKRVSKIVLLGFGVVV